VKINTKHRSPLDGTVLVCSREYSAPLPAGSRLIKNKRKGKTRSLEAGAREAFEEIVPTAISESAWIQLVSNKLRHSYETHSDNLSIDLVYRSVRWEGQKSLKPHISMRIILPAADPLLESLVAKPVGCLGGNGWNERRTCVGMISPMSSRARSSSSSPLKSMTLILFDTVLSPRFGSLINEKFRTHIHLE
jgi:hypothetical protein